MYQVTIKGKGAMVDAFREEGIFVTFGDNAPDTLKDFCYSIDVNPVDGEVTPGCKLVIDGKEDVYKRQDKDKELAPASVTKIMSLLLIFEDLKQGKIKLTDTVTVSEHAASMGGSQVFLETGEKQQVQTLIKCVVISSANDAVVALAEHVCGSEEAFVSRMNKKARELGMKHTIFQNACGLDAKGHVTSAYDIALMTRELAQRYPEVFKYTKIWMDTIIHKTKKGEKEFGLSNTNKLRCV